MFFYVKTCASQAASFAIGSNTESKLNSLENTCEAVANMPIYLKASSIDSGNFSPNVSGKNVARAPATVATTPMMNTGAGNQ